MKMFGSWSELVNLIFRKDSQAITLRPNQTTTYTASRDVQLAPEDAASVLVSQTATQTLTNKTLTSPVINSPTGITKSDVGLGNVDNTSDATKNAATVTLTNKTISGASNTLTNIPAGTALSGQVPTANGGTGVNSTATFPTSGVVTTDAGTTVLQNKTLDNTNSATFKDTLLAIVDNADTSKVVNFELSGITTGQTRVLTVPDANTTLVGTGVTQVITNKDIDGGTASNTSRLTVPKASTATLAGLTRKQGTLVYDSSLLKFFGDTGSALVAIGSGSGSGSGEVNAVLNPVADTDLTGYTNGTSHTATRVTSGSPLDPITTTAISVAATTTASESSTSGEYYTISTQPTGLRNKKLKFEFYFTTETAQTWAISIYSGSTRMALSTDSSGATLLPAGVTGKYTTYFDADASTSYTVHFTRTAGSGTATLIFTGLIVGPGIQPQGAVAGPITAFTPSFNNTTGLTVTARGQWQRVGDSLHLAVNAYLAGTGSSGSTFQLNLPVSNTTVPVGSYGAGTVSLKNADINSRVMFVRGLGSSVVEFTLSDTLSTSIVGTNLGDVAAANTISFIEFTAILPINEWAGSGTVNLGQNDVEYVSNSSVADSADTSSFLYGPAGSSFPGALTANRSKRVRFLSPIQAGDVPVIEVDPDGVGDWAIVEQSRIGGSKDATHGMSWQFVTGSNTDIDVNFGSAGFNATTLTSAAPWSTLSSGKWRVRKQKAGVAVGFGMADLLGNSGLVKAGQVPGITSGAAISTGYIGETFKDTSSTAPTNSNQNLATRTLPAGKWKITLLGSYDAGNQNAVMVSISTTSLTMDATNKTSQSSTSGGLVAVCNVEIVNISVPTTYYAVVLASTTFTGGTYLTRVFYERIG